MVLEIISNQCFDNYHPGDVIKRYDMTTVMDVSMGKNRVFIRLFDRNKQYIAWSAVEYPRAKVNLRFTGAGTGTYNHFIWTNRNRKGMS